MLFLKISKLYDSLGDQYRSSSYKKAYLQWKNNKELTEDMYNKLKNKDLLKEKYRTLNTPKNRKIIKFTKYLGVGVKLSKQLVSEGISEKEYREDYPKNKMQKFGVKWWKVINKTYTKEEVEKVYLSLKRKIRKESILSGSYMYKRKEIGDIDIIILGEKYKLDFLEDIYNLDKHSYIGIYKNGNEYYKIDFKFVKKEDLATYKLYFSSGKWFNKWIRGKAKEKGMKLNQYGIVKDGKMYKFKEEKEVFDFLGLEYVRYEDRDEVL